MKYLNIALFTIFTLSFTTILGNWIADDTGIKYGLVIGNLFLAYIFLVKREREGLYTIMDLAPITSIIFWTMGIIFWFLLDTIVGLDMKIFDKFALILGSILLNIFVWVMYIMNFHHIFTSELENISNYRP